MADRKTRAARNTKMMLEALNQYFDFKKEERQLLKPKDKTLHTINDTLIEYSPDSGTTKELITKSSNVWKSQYDPETGETNQILVDKNTGIQVKDSESLRSAPTLRWVQEVDDDGNTINVAYNQSGKRVTMEGDPSVSKLAAKQATVGSGSGVYNIEDGKIVGEAVVDRKPNTGRPVLRASRNSEGKPVWISVKPDGTIEEVEGYEPMSLSANKPTTSIKKMDSGQFAIITVNPDGKATQQVIGEESPIYKKMEEMINNSGEKPDENGFYKFANEALDFWGKQMSTVLSRENPDAIDLEKTDYDKSDYDKYKK